MKRTVLIVLLLIGLLPLGSCSWIKERREARKERKAEADEEKAGARDELAAPKEEGRWRRMFRYTPKAERWVEISFPDPALNRAVRNAIHRPQKGKLYRSDVDHLEVLKIPGWNVRDLSGMENCLSLTKLDISWNPQIKDLSPLKGLENMRELYLRNLAVENITPLAGLTEITTLDLANNHVSNLNPLAGLGNLTYLDLSFNDIENIGPLRNCKRLSTLKLYHNKIHDLSPLAGLLDLTDLDLASNRITDLDALVQNSGRGGLGSNDAVNLFGNNLSANALKTQIPLLEERGAEVRTEYARYKDL